MASSLLDLEKKLKSFFNQGAQTVGKFANNQIQQLPPVRAFNNVQTLVNTPKFQQSVIKPIQSFANEQRQAQNTIRQNQFNLIKPVVKLASPSFEKSTGAKLFQGDILGGLKAIPSTIQSANEPYRQQAQLLKTKKIADLTSDEKKKVFEPSYNAVTGILGPSVGKIKVNSKYEPAVKRLLGRLTKEDVLQLDEFTHAVNKAGSMGNRVNVGEVGPYIQAFLKEAYGNKAVNWTNKEARDAIQYTLKRLVEKGMGPSVGLAAKDVSKNFAKSIEPGIKSVGDIMQDGFKPGTGLPEFNPLPVNPPKKIGWLNQGLNRVRNVIESQGPAGKQLGSDLRTARDLAETSAGGWVSRLKTVGNLTKEEFNNFVDVAEGRGAPLNAKVSQAVGEWDLIRNEVFNKAKESGVELGKIENYFPHTYDEKIFKNKNTYNEAINHLVNTGQAKDQADAIRLLSYARDVVRNRKHGNLEFERMVNLPNYEKTKDALFGYIESAANRIAQAQTFGPKDEKALQLIEQIARSGGDASTVKNAFDIAAGAKNYGSLQSKISTGLRAYNAYTKLGLGALTNTGQNVNTATVTGAIRTLVNAPKAAFSKEAKDFALQAGVTLDGVLKDLKDGSGFGGKVFGKLGAPGFNQVEKFNRTLAAVAGRDYARSLASKGDAKTLAKMGIVLKGNRLTPEQEIQAARNIVERTQFKVDPQDLPGWASSPWGKVFSQFRTFSYNQSAFIAREILEPIKRGNFAPLARFILIGGPVGYGVVEGRNILRNRKSEESPVKRTIQSYQAVGGLGLGGDIFTGLFPMNNRYLSPDRANNLAVGTLGGPSFGSAMEGWGGVSSAVQGKPANLARFGLKQVPLVGSTLQNTILPYKAENGDLNRRFDFGSTANAQEVAPITNTSAQSKSLTPIEEAKIDQQIKDLTAQQKKVLEDNGFSLPFVGQVGGSSDEEKNKKYLELEGQIKALKSAKNYESEQKAYESAAYALASDRLKRAEDFTGWVQATESYVKSLKEYQKTLDPEFDKTEILRIQNDIEDKEVQLSKYKGQGGFTKGKRPKKISIRRASAPRLSFKGSNIGSGKKVPVIKITKGPVKAAASPIRTIKVVTPARKISYKIQGPTKIQGLTQGVKLV